MMKATDPVRVMKRQLLAWVLGTVSVGSVLAAERGPDAPTSMAWDILTGGGGKGGFL